MNKIVLTNLKIKSPRKVINLLIHLFNLKSQQIKSPRMFRKTKEIIFWIKKISARLITIMMMKLKSRVHLIWLFSKMDNNMDKLLKMTFLKILNMKRKRWALKFLKDKNSKRVIFFLKLASLNKVPKRKSQCTDTKINWRIETAFWKIKYYLRLVLTFHILLKFRKMLRNSKNAGVIAKKLLRCCHLRKN